MSKWGSKWWHVTIPFIRRIAWSVAAAMLVAISPMLMGVVYGNVPPDWHQLTVLFLLVLVAALLHSYEDAIKASNPDLAAFLDEIDQKILHLAEQQTEHMTAVPPAGGDATIPVPPKS